jgi:DNA repair exonuclease SbcCD ATPase subunit
MIVFQKIRWRNFLSTGNNFTEVNFRSAPTTLIVGANGAGKSTILDALTFVLYNKPFRRINKGQLINSVNEKDCVVEIEFGINDRSYKVIRGIKPNVFEIHCNGEVWNRESSAVDQQKHLEETILKLNYKSFTQTVILGSATFVPFMQLSSSNRRDIVEDLLDIKIFSGMGNLLKNRIRQATQDIRELSLQKDLVEEKISMQKNFIRDLDKRGKENIEDKKTKIEGLSLDITNLMGDNRIYNENITDVYQPQLQELSDPTKSLRRMNGVKSKLEQKIQNITKEHRFFKDNSVCPTCGQDIEEQFRVNKVGEIENQVQEINTAYKALKKTITAEQDREKEFAQLSRLITDTTYDISINNTKISEYQKQTRSLESEIQKIASQIANRNSERDALKQLEKELKSVEKDKSEQAESISYLDFAHSLMKDSGVKSKIIKRYLPVMNKQINTYLQQMDFYINFTLDEEFKENIKSPIHENFSYDSFSEGEKMRIDLALLFTWRDIARMKNSSSTNLLILDEIFDSSLDGTGTDEFTKIVRYAIKDANVFIISHNTQDLQDKFDNMITFSKVNGFSKTS